MEPAKVRCDDDFISLEWIGDQYMHRSVRLVLAALVVAACLVQAQAASAQLLVFDEELYVTVLRADKFKIGVAPKPGVKARQWVRLEGKTLVYRRNGRSVSHETMWRALRPGMRIRVQGGADWDTNIVAKKIWY